MTACGGGAEAGRDVIAYWRSNVASNKLLLPALATPGSCYFYFIEGVAIEGLLQRIINTASTALRFKSFIQSSHKGHV